MSFSDTERALLLKVPYVGKTVIQRLEEVGYDSFAKLSEVSVDALLELLSGYLNSSCYKNSPQARKSIEGAIQCAGENRKYIL